MRTSLILSALLATTLVAGTALADRSNRDRDRHKENVKEAAFKQRGEYFDQYEKATSTKQRVARDYDKTRAHREAKSNAPRVNDKLRQVGRFEDEPVAGSNKKRQSAASYSSDKTAAKREAMKQQAAEGMRAYKSMDKGPMLDAARRGFDEESGSSGKASNKKKARVEQKVWSDKTMEKREAMKQERLEGMRAYKSMDKGPELAAAREGTNGSSASSAAAPDHAPAKAQKDETNVETKERSGASRDW
jgi:hypothetical protein